MRKICSSRSSRRIRVLSSCAEFETVTERFLDHHAPPALRLAIAQLLIQQPRVAELLDERTEEAVGHCEVEQTVPAGLPFPCDVVQMQPQFLEQVAIAEIALQIGHPIGQASPHGIVDRLDAVFTGRVSNEALQHGMQTVTPILGTALGDVDADDGEMFGDEAGAREIIQRRHKQTLREVAAGAKDHHSAGAGRLRLTPRRRLNETGRTFG